MRPQNDKDVSLATIARRDVRIHDPSTLVRCGDFFYGFGTGPGVPFFRSRDLVKWERDKAWRVFPDPSVRPAWWNDIVPNFDGKLLGRRHHSNGQKTVFSVLLGFGLGQKHVGNRPCYQYDA